MVISSIDNNIFLSLALPRYPIFVSNSSNTFFCVIYKHTGLALASFYGLSDNFCFLSRNFLNNSYNVLSSKLISRLYFYCNHFADRHGSFKGANLATSGLSARYTQRFFFRSEIGFKFDSFKYFLFIIYYFGNSSKPVFIFNYLTDKTISIKYFLSIK